MKLSPIQLIQSKFIKISVEVNDDFVSETQGGGERFVLDIEHMMHIERHSPTSTDPDEPVQYLLALGIRSGKDNTQAIPYVFELVVTAIISAAPKQFPSANNLDDSAAKYGFSILFGQIRESLSSITVRMNAGQFNLPTMSFIDVTFGQAQGNSSIKGVNNTSDSGALGPTDQSGPPRVS